MAAPERAWTAPVPQYMAAAIMLPQGVVDVMQDGYSIQDTSLQYSGGLDTSAESTEV